MILPIVDVITSVFAGCVVFVTLGFMAEEAGVPIENVVDSGKMENVDGIYIFPGISVAFILYDGYMLH